MGTDEPDRSGDDLRARLRTAALEAERATGARELSERRAQRHIVVRIGIIAIGTIVLLGGLAMLVLPGPGIVGVLAGLGILAQELAWAERLLNTVKERTKVDQIRRQPAWVRVVLVAATVAGVGATAVYLL